MGETPKSEVSKNQTLIFHVCSDERFLNKKSLWLSYDSQRLEGGGDLLSHNFVQYHRRGQV